MSKHNDSYRKVAVETRLALIGCSVETKYTLSDTESYRPDIVLSEGIPGMSTRKTALDWTFTNAFASYMFRRAANGPLVAANSGAARKTKQNEKRMSTVGCDFIALSFEVTGGCTPETEACINYVLSQKALVHNLPFSEVYSEFWLSLSCTIQKANARALRERLTAPKTLYLPDFSVEDDADPDTEDSNPQP